MVPEVLLVLGVATFFVAALTKRALPRLPDVDARSRQKGDKFASYLFGVGLILVIVGALLRLNDPSPNELVTFVEEVGWARVFLMFGGSITSTGGFYYLLYRKKAPNPSLPGHVQMAQWLSPRIFWVGLPMVIVGLIWSALD